MIDAHIGRYGSIIGIAAACAVFGVSERSYRHRAKSRRDKLVHDAQHNSTNNDGTRAGQDGPDAPMPTTAPNSTNRRNGDAATPSNCRYCKPEQTRATAHKRALHPGAMSLDERERVLGLLCSERFVDMSAEQVFWTVLDEGKYYCSVRSMYRILSAHQASSDRRRRRHRSSGSHAVPRLWATGPNQVWTWDVTLFPTPTKAVFIYLYAVIDIFSRKIVGWMIADCESKENAEKLIVETRHRQGVARKQLTIHADRGSIMKARNVSDIFIKLGITKSHSRPRVSNDNPYIESFFKTTKYRYDYPLNFASLRAARRWFTKFVIWYNTEHHHSGIAYFHPNQVHDGSWKDVHVLRQQTLDQACKQHPKRFNRRPVVDTPPTKVWINQPPEEAEAPLIEPGETGGSDEEVMPV